MPAVAITVAPNALASWTAAEPGTSGRGVDEHDVARPDPSPDAQRQVAEQEREVHGDRLGCAEPLRDLLGTGAVEQRRRRVGTLRPRSHADDPPAEKGLTPRTGRVDGTGGRHADDERRLEVQQSVAATDGVDVVEVQAEGLRR